MVRALIISTLLMAGAANAAQLKNGESTVMFDRTNDMSIKTEYCSKKECVSATFTTFDFSDALDNATAFIEAIYSDKDYFSEYVRSEVKNAAPEETVSVNMGGVFAVEATADNFNELVNSQRSVEKGLFAFYRAIHSEELMKQFQSRMDSDAEVDAEASEFLLHKTLSVMMIKRVNNV